jgi:hypothetical protein
MTAKLPTSASDLISAALACDGQSIRFDSGAWGCRLTVTFVDGSIPFVAEGIDWDDVAAQAQYQLDRSASLWERRAS